MPKPKKKIHNPLCIWDSTFRVNYYASYGIPLKDFVASAKKHICDPEMTDELGRDGCIREFRHKGAKITWIWTRKKDLAVLYHECGHAIFETLRSKNVTILEESEEVYLYQVDMLVRKVLGKKF